jgi:hypothetical protein
MANTRRSDITNISQQLEEYMQQHPDIAETLYAFQEVQAIYLEAMQIMRQAEIEIYNPSISTSDSTIAKEVQP